MIYNANINDIIVRDYSDFSVVYNLNTNRYSKINEVANIFLNLSAALERAAPYSFPPNLPKFA